MFSFSDLPGYMRCQDHGMYAKNSDRYRAEVLKTMRQFVYGADKRARGIGLLEPFLELIRL